MNRLSALFNNRDKKPRHTKSISALPQLENGWTEVHDGSRVNARQPGVGPASLQDANRHAVQQSAQQRAVSLPQKPPGQQRPASWQRLPASQVPASNSAQLAGPVMRASTVPTVRLHPPDELFLRVIRRRSANAMLEPQRVYNETGQSTQEEPPIEVAIAGALPPDFLDSPPSYLHSTPDRGLTSRSQFLSRAATIERRTDELFLDPLKVQIDEAIRDFSSIVATQATPTDTPPVMAPSPVNEIDQYYHERRRQRKREAAEEAARDFMNNKK